MTHRRLDLITALLLHLGVARGGCYAPPGLLGQLVDEKRREVERISKLPEAREDGPWSLRLNYPAGSASYALGRTIGYRRERPTVLVDLKRASPTGKLGVAVPVAPDMVVSASLARAVKLGVDGAFVCTDLASYGGSTRDLKDASAMTRDRSLGGAAADGAAAALPIVAKDLFVDPLQIARAACEGAQAVVLIAAACLADLSLLLDTCTLLGLEAVVEVHTPEEVTVAAECGASILLVNERDRATGRLVLGQAAGLASVLPPDAACLACGGIARIDQVRTLRRAGYDGFVLGRALAGDPRKAEALMRAIADEPPSQRWSEVVTLPRTTRYVDVTEAAAAAAELAEEE